MKPAVSGVVRVLPVAPECQTVSARLHTRTDTRMCEHKHSGHGLRCCFVNVPRRDPARAGDVYKDVTGGDYKAP